MVYRYYIYIFVSVWEKKIEKMDECIFAETKTMKKRKSMKLFWFGKLPKRERKGDFRVAVIQQYN